MTRCISICRFCVQAGLSETRTFEEVRDLVQALKTLIDRAGGIHRARLERNQKASALINMAQAVTNTPTLPVCPYFQGCQGSPGNLLKISQLYHNPEDSKSFFCSPRPAELCTQTFLLLHADPTVLWSRPYNALALIHRRSRADATVA